MKISYIDIQNFRKLKSCTIDVNDKNTLFVGANNSGKTSAMEAIILFLKKSGSISLNDFTLSNWQKLNDLGEKIISEKDFREIPISDWFSILPTLDIWLEVKKSEINHVAHIIPSLNWNCNLLGVRMVYQPEDFEKLYIDYIEAIEIKNKLIQELGDSRDDISDSIWPKDFGDFVKKSISKHFSIGYYKLDPNKSKVKIKEGYSPQTVDNSFGKLEKNPLKDIIKVDLIEAQREFTLADLAMGNNDKSGKLSKQLQEYYKEHLNPERMPSINDIKAIKAMRDAEIVFDKNLQESFSDSINQIQKLGYPGVANPQIKISTKLTLTDGLKHESSVQYNVSKNEELILPERYNGLGYQNLISIVFELMRFRDSWMRVGKSRGVGKSKKIEPIHLVLVEEPEAHLHAQVQQVFIKKAYEILRNHELLEENDIYVTQLLISTHSSSIVHASDILNLRYFKRISVNEDVVSPITEVVNMSTVFGDEKETKKFVIRYLKTTHCDLFFADAVIMIEGSAERILLPQFIKKIDVIDSSYISILEINGSHAHRLRSLIETLGISCLILTDLDAVSESNQKSSIPKRNMNLVTNNDTLKSWDPGIKCIDTLLDLDDKDKIIDGSDKGLSNIKVEYQIPIKINFKQESNIEVIANTFEDAIVYQNIDLFSKISGTGLIRGFKKDIAESKDTEELSQKLFDRLHAKGAKKAEFALDLLLCDEVETLEMPKYIKNGLEWLVKQVCTKREEESINER
ncbi:MAG: AAA family ATPase [Paeniclostridium sordellii]|nr:AAA family ATPase [Paeniclostridium sordellii]